MGKTISDFLRKTVVVVFFWGAVVASVSMAQIEYTAVRLYWDANPASQNVGWYIVQAKVRGEWNFVNNTSQCKDGTCEFWSAFSDINYSGAPDSSVCYRLRAARAGEVGPFSEELCITMPAKSGGDPIIPPNPDNSLTKPANLQYELKP